MDESLQHVRQAPALPAWVSQPRRNQGPLYLRVDGKRTLEFLNGRHFNYTGSTADGKTVYIRSSEKLTADDKDESADLFVWHEESPNDLTRVSFGSFGNAGNEDECGGATWSGDGCSIEVTDFRAYAKISAAGQGGNTTTLSDQSIASKSGDIYFLSPERLIAGQGRGRRSEPLPVPPRRGQIRRAR